MARVTSSSNRSKRSTKKPVSTDKGRKARARVSQARVTSASNGKVSGSASSRVTQGQGGSRGSGSSPSTKPNGRQPRAITNGNSPAMKQIRAKAVQARRQAQGKSTVASRNQSVTPTNARGQRIRQMANSQRVIGDSGQVRAAQTQGARNVAQAQARRGAKAATKAMAAKLKQAALKRTAAGGLKAGVKGAVFAEGLTSRNTGDGTLTAAMKRGDYKPKQGPAVPERLTQKGVDKKTFDDAFRQARQAKAKTFTWRGKKYTTEMK